MPTGAKCTGLNLNHVERSKMFRRSDYVILSAVAISLFLSVGLWFGGDREMGLFVGIWVPSILSFGCLIKLITRK